MRRLKHEMKLLQIQQSSSTDVSWILDYHSKHNWNSINFRCANCTFQLNYSTKKIRLLPAFTLTQQTKMKCLVFLLVWFHPWILEKNIFYNFCGIIQLMGKYHSEYPLTVMRLPTGQFPSKSCLQSIIV